MQKDIKNYDLASASYSVNTTGSLTLMHVPLPGYARTQRVGNKTSLKHLCIRGRVILNVTNTSSATQQSRLMVVYDTQPNAALPSVTDILNQANPESQRRLDNEARFFFVHDQSFEFSLVNVTVGTYGTPIIHNVLVEKFLPPTLTVFNGTNGGTIADITTGALYMFWIGSNAAGGNDCTFIGTTRTLYTDE